MGGLADLEHDALPGVVEAFGAQGLTHVVLRQNAIALGLTGGGQAIADLSKGAGTGLQMNHNDRGQALTESLL